MNFRNRKNENCELVSENRVGIDKITEFLKKNVRYVSRGAMVFALAAVLMLTTACNGNNNGGEQKQSQKEEEQTPAPTEEPKAEKDEYEVDAHPEVKELISTYYSAYATGDIDKLESITQSLSDMEKSYIKMLGEHVENYSDVTCYTKESSEEGAFLVSVTFTMNYSGLEGGLPGMDFFYVRTNEEGSLYIDNLYSSFNREMGEQETVAEIDSMIAEFEGGEDVQKLREEVQGKYNDAIASDENLKKTVDAVSEAIRQWKDSYTPEEPKEENKVEEPKQEEPADDKKEKPADDKKEKSADDKKEKPEEKEKAPEENQEQAPEENQEQAPEEAPEEAPQEDTTPEINYVPEGKVLTASSSYNVRKSMGESSELVGTTAEGDSIKVILSYAEGWTKVEWNGQTGYIRTDLLLNN